MEYINWHSCKDEHEKWALTHFLKYKCMNRTVQRQTSLVSGSSSDFVWDHTCPVTSPGGGCGGHSDATGRPLQLAVAAQVPQTEATPAGRGF